MAGNDSVAVVIPTKDRAELLEEAIASAQQQTYAPAEIIVVDDGSAAPVDEAGLRARHGPRIRVLRNAVSQGLAYSRNRGVEACSADYIIHLDDDDLLSPTAIEKCLEASHAHPGVEVWFIGVKDFGPYSDHFNTVQPAGVSHVRAEAHGTPQAFDITLFDQRLFPALLHRVPMAFQRVFTKPAIWAKISRLRWRAYMAGNDLRELSAAKHAITGTLRDSEWARYAAMISQSTGLIDQALYRQRCSGQGYSSQAGNIEKHLLQGASMMDQMLAASDVLPELRKWRREIRESLAQAYFDISYHYAQTGDRLAAWRHLRKSVTVKPAIRDLRLALRLCLGASNRKST